MNDWSWQEVSNEEFERRRKKDTYYKIFSVSGRRPNVVKKTHYKFWAKERVAALRVLRRFAKENADGPYYYMSDCIITMKDMASLTRGTGMKWRFMKSTGRRCLI